MVSVPICKGNATYITFKMIKNIYVLIEEKGITIPSTLLSQVVELLISSGDVKIIAGAMEYVHVFIYKYQYIFQVCCRVLQA